MAKGFGKQLERIKNVFPKEMEDIYKRSETIEVYKKFLIHNLNDAVKLKGVGDFNWEEFYIFGPGSKKEYEHLKKENPSYTDIYLLNSIADEYDEHYGLFAHVVRESDKKKFQIPLADLKAIDTASKDYQLLDDYSVWCVNY